MITYTTPALHLTVEGKLLTQDHDVRVTIVQGSYKLTKKGSDLTITAGQTDTEIVFALTQEESGQFKWNKACEIQVNWIDQNGVREATEIGEIDVMKNLLDEVIVHGD